MFGLRIQFLRFCANSGDKTQKNKKKILITKFPYWANSVSKSQFSPLSVCLCVPLQKPCFLVDWWTGSLKFCPIGVF